jgi:uncharacterized protein (TIGR03437 family)
LAEADVVLHQAIRVLLKSWENTYVVLPQMIVTVTQARRPRLLTLVWRLMKSAALSALIAAPTCAQTKPPFDFLVNGIQSAKVATHGGVPTLLINGQAVPPLLFQYQGFRSDPVLFWPQQAQDAATHGIHLYKIQILFFPWDHGKNGVPMDYSSVDQRIALFLQSDPLGVFLLQLGVNPSGDWAPSVPPIAADQITLYDGTVLTGQPSIASDIYANGFLTSAQQLVQHLEASPLARHILGYNIAAQNTGEWFPYDYVANGPDYSSTNAAKFRVWLTNQYGSDANLSKAWGSAITLNTAQIPLIDRSRLPLSGTPPGSPIISFYQTPGEQNWIDYSRYTSEIFSQRILDIAAMLRTATRGNRLISFYNGYTFDLAASFNAHLRIDRLLASPNIDLICSPISYTTNVDRLGGGPAGAMSARDSIAAHGKLQIAEDDLRTYLAQASLLPDLAYNGTATSGFDETLGILRRNFASVMIHRSGTWWMDLNENGAFNDSRLWQVMSDGLELYGQLLSAPKAYQPDIGLVVDPPSIAYEKNDYTLTVATRALLRNALGRTGTAFGVYLLDDFLSGTLPPCKVYIFANLWYLTDNQIAAIQGRLDAEGATAIWQYAPGYLGGPNGPDESRVSRLTGITLKRVDGASGTSGSGLMSGHGWGWPYNQNIVSPRFTVADSSATVLGNYFADHLVSSAQKKVGNFTSIFFGDFGLETPDPATGVASGDMLRAVLNSAGVHIWTDNGEIVHTDGSFLAINRLPAGLTHIHLPIGVSAVPLDGETVTPNGDGIDVNFNQYETHFFSLQQMTPSIASVVNGADFKPEPLSPGAWISILGQNLGQAATPTAANTFTLGGAGVSVCGIAAALSYNSGPVTTNGSMSWQLNALVPDGASGQTSCSVVVTVAGQSSQPASVTIASGVMELFGFASAAGPLPIITHADYTLVGPVTAGLTPAKPSETVIAWGTGDCSLPSVTVGGTSATVPFSGRVEPGLCQINFVVPTSLSGSNPLRLSTSPNPYSLWVSP